MYHGPKYIVTTHWGTFRLDEASYQDYLAGKLWISWKPGTSQPEQTPNTYIPPNVTDQALTLRTEAEQNGLLPTLECLNLPSIPLPYRDRLAEQSIDELNLTVRSSNGLKRAGILTFGLLYGILQTDYGLSHIRNIGRKSMDEIQRTFLEACYLQLLPYEKARYWQDLLDRTPLK